MELCICVCVWECVCERERESMGSISIYLQYLSWQFLFSYPLFSVYLEIQMTKKIVKLGSFISLFFQETITLCVNCLLFSLEFVLPFHYGLWKGFLFFFWTFLRRFLTDSGRNEAVRSCNVKPLPLVIQQKFLESVTALSKLEPVKIKAGSKKFWAF